MRRALTAGLTLYLTLGGVLSSPVEVQVPFELNKEDIPEVKHTSTSASELQLWLFYSHPPIVAALALSVRSGSRESRLIRTVAI